MTAQAQPMRFRADFTRFADSTTLPPGYYRNRFASAGASTVVANNALRQNGGTVTNFTGGMRVAVRPSQGVVDNFDVYIRAKPITSGFGTSYFPGFTFRATIGDDLSLNPARAYYVALGNVGVSLQRQTASTTATVTGGNLSSNIATFTSPVAANDVFHVRFQVRGDHMRARCWRAGEPEPTNWPARGLDNTHPRKGEMQLWLQSGSVSNATIEWQEVTVQQLPLPVNKVNSDVTGAVYRYTTPASPTIPASIGGNVAIFNASTQSLTPTLPHPALLPGLPIVVKRDAADVSSNTVTLGVPAGVTIDGAANLTLTRGDALILTPDGGNNYLITGVYT